MRHSALAGEQSASRCDWESSNQNRTTPLWRSMSGLQAAMGESPLLPTTSPLHFREGEPISRPTWDPRLKQNVASLMRRLLFTGVPSASTPVHGLRRTRQSHSSRGVAFHDDEVLVRRFHVAGAKQWSRSATEPHCERYLRSQPAEAEWQTVGGRCVVGICHQPKTAANSLTRGFPASPDCTSRARRRRGHGNDCSNS